MLKEVWMRTIRAKQHLRQALEGTGGWENGEKKRQLQQQATRMLKLRDCIGHQQNIRHSSKMKVEQVKEAVKEMDLMQTNMRDVFAISRQGPANETDVYPQFKLLPELLQVLTSGCGDDPEHTYYRTFRHRQATFSNADEQRHRMLLASGKRAIAAVLDLAANQGLIAPEPAIGLEPEPEGHDACPQTNDLVAERGPVQFEEPTQAPGTTGGGFHLLSQLSGTSTCSDAPSEEANTPGVASPA